MLPTLPTNPIGLMRPIQSIHGINMTMINQSSGLRLAPSEGGRVGGSVGWMYGGRPAFWLFNGLFLPSKASCWFHVCLYSIHLTFETCLSSSPWSNPRLGLRQARDHGSLDPPETTHLVLHHQISFHHWIGLYHWLSLHLRLIPIPIVRLPIPLFPFSQELEYPHRSTPDPTIHIAHQELSDSPTDRFHRPKMIKAPPALDHRMKPRPKMLVEISQKGLLSPRVKR